VEEEQKRMEEDKYRIRMALKEISLLNEKKRVYFVIF
jgi:hypothetical protein